MELTKAQARRFLLAHHGLWPPRRLKGKAGVLAHVRRVGCLQYDPLDPVGTNPNLVLQSRIEGYKPQLLEELLYVDRALVDGWDKNLSIYPVEDWPCFLRFCDEARARYSQDPAILGALPVVREALTRQGPSTSSDLDLETKVSWAWGPTRLARATLESMYFWGELIIHHKIGKRKVYDFASKHLPQDLLAMPDPNPSLLEYHAWHLKRRIGSVGLLWNKPSDAWLGIRGLKSRERADAISFLVDKGEICPVAVEGETYYCRRQDLDHLEPGKPRAQAAFLAPLDSLLWDRRLIREFFGFSYTWEVYKPAQEREYGYYVLPVVFGETFIARFEPKVDRRTKTLQILNWWWEEGVRPSISMQKALVQAFQAFMSYLGVSGLELTPRAQKELPWLREECL